MGLGKERETKERERERETEKKDSQKSLSSRSFSSRAQAILANKQPKTQAARMVWQGSKVLESSEHLSPFTVAPLLSVWIWDLREDRSLPPDGAFGQSLDRPEM